MKENVGFSPKGAAGGFVPITKYRYLDGELVEITEEDLKAASVRNKEMEFTNQCVSLALTARKLEEDEDTTDISVGENNTHFSRAGWNCKDPPRPEVKEGYSNLPKRQVSK